MPRKVALRILPLAGGCRGRGVHMDIDVWEVESAHGNGEVSDLFWKHVTRRNPLPLGPPQVMDSGLIGREGVIIGEV